MAMEPNEKFSEILNKAQRPIILLPESPSGDAIGAGWAIAKAFARRGIESPIVFSDPTDKAELFGFLPRPKEILSDIKGAIDFVMIFKTDKNKILEVREEKKEDELRVIITPERGSIDPKSFSFVPAQCKYDMAIFVGCRDKESLGRIYQENPDVFYEIPIVNIDYHADNEDFGQINLVDLKASSTSEVLADIFLHKSEDYLDGGLAQCLLAGIISETNSFQKKNTTPRSLTIAAQLIEKGADQQEIIRHLYKTQPFHLLKLLGRVMTKLVWYEEKGLVLANIDVDDFVQSRTKPSHLGYALDQIRNNYALGKIFCALYQEKEGEYIGNIKTSREELLKATHRALGGKLLDDMLVFTVTAKSFEEAGQMVRNRV